MSQTIAIGEIIWQKYLELGREAGSLGRPTSNGVDFGNGQMAAHFAAQRDDYTRYAFRRIVAAREDLARELLSQINEENGDFAALAREHSLDHRAAELTGMRWQLPAPLIAALAGAKIGDMIGPLALRDGFHLLRVEAIEAPELDDATRAVIGQRLLDGWVRSQFAGQPLTLQPVQESGSSLRA